jgi:hypothetical protein
LETNNKESKLLLLQSLYDGSEWWSTVAISDKPKSGFPTQSHIRQKRQRERERERENCMGNAWARERMVL